MHDNGLDGLLVLARASAKALNIYCDELGEDGLGKVRSAACKDAASEIERDISQMLEGLLGAQQLN